MLKAFRRPQGERFDGFPNATVLNGLWGAAAAFFAVFVLLYVVTIRADDGWLLDAHQFVVGRDFLNFWMAGKLGLMADPAIYYHPDVYMDALAAIGADGQLAMLSYPPTQFLFGLPFGWMPYHVAYVAWLGVNFGAFWFAVRPLAGASLRWLAVLSPAGLAWLLCGQSSLLTAALMLTALRLCDRRPWVAGLCIGLLLIKPQLAVLFPVFLIVTGRWRCFAAASVTVLSLVGMTLLCFGMAPWVAYWEVGMPNQLAVLLHTTDMVNSLTPTVFNDVVLVGAGASAAFVWQGIQTLGAIALLVWGCRWRVVQPPQQLLFFLTLSVLSTCYLMAYDLVALTFALLLVLAAQPVVGWRRWVFVGCFWLPLLDFALSVVGIPGPSLLLVALAILLLHDAPKRTAVTASATPV